MLRDCLALLRPLMVSLPLAITLMASSAQAADTPRCSPAPLGETQLFLRGTMNNWTASEDHEFQYHCDAYYLNVALQGRQEFKIGDPAWADASTFGGHGSFNAGQKLPLARGKEGGNLVFSFEGEQTLRLAFDQGRPTLVVGPKSFADPRRVAITNPVALSLRFDSRSATHKRPFGAVTEGTVVDFAIDAQPGVATMTLVIEKRRLEGNQEVLEYSEVARLPMSKARHAPQERWTARHRFTEKAVYGYYFVAQIGDQAYVYQNNRDSIYWTREKGSNGVGSVDLLPANRKQIRRFRTTVFAKDFVVPAYAKDLVYYYVFPERFRNGDKTNDPKVGRDTYQDKPIEVHARWAGKPFRPDTGDGSDKVFNNDFFGGDLAGIIEKLDYIAELGANAIYMTPVFTAASNHKYDTADYHNIDPRFGSNADFERLCKEAAKRGIRVILDVSLNHTGSDSIYFDRFAKHARDGKKGAFYGGKPNPQSPWYDWYRFDTTQTAPDKQYSGWVGVADLPELNKQSASFRRFAYGPGGVMQQWLDAGAAGWRMDVAPWVPDDFWAEWRKAVKAHRPGAITIAETWFEASKHFLGDGFDSTMNYVLRNALLDYAAGKKARELVHNVELMREVYPPQAFYALMNVLSTHDAARSVHVLGWHDDLKDPAKIGEAKQRYKLALFFQMTFPGAPAIFYGDEVGMTGGDDPFNRGPYPWADEGGQPDLDMLAEVKRLTSLRRAHAVLRHGSLGAPLLADDHVIVHARQLGQRWAITATNNANTPQTVTVVLPAAAAQHRQWQDALTGAKLQPTGQRLTLTVPPLYGSVILAR